MKDGKYCPSMFNLEPPNRCVIEATIFLYCVCVRMCALTIITNMINLYNGSFLVLCQTLKSISISEYLQMQNMPIKYLISISNLINWKQNILFSELDKKLLCSSNLHHPLYFGQITWQAHKFLFLLSHEYDFCTGL